MWNRKPAHCGTAALLLASALYTGVSTPAYAAREATAEEQAAAAAAEEQAARRKSRHRPPSRGTANRPGRSDPSRRRLNAPSFNVTINLINRLVQKGCSQRRTLPICSNKPSRCRHRSRADSAGCHRCRATGGSASDQQRVIPESVPMPDAVRDLHSGVRNRFATTSRTT